MAGRVEQDPHVLLRLELRHGRPQRCRVLGRSLEVGDLEVEVQLHLRIAGTARPDGTDVVLLGLETEVDGRVRHPDRAPVGLVGGQLADVTALHLTDSSGRSVEISAQAAPILRQEALTARSAKIDLVSGATFTSEAYVSSLQSALDAAASQR